VGSPDQYEDLRRGVREVCADFPDGYWRELDARREYPEAFIEAMTKSGYLGALIPEEYGGLGLSLTKTTIILEEINRSGGNAQPAHAQVYVMGTMLRHGSEQQKRKYLPKIASGQLRMQAFGVTEPEAEKPLEIDKLEESFHAVHERRYGYRMEDEPVELVNPRLIATVPVDKPVLRESPAKGEAESGRREADFDGEWQEVPILDRERMGKGSEVVGPAIVEFREATCVVRPGWQGLVDGGGTLVLEKE
jgi:N-methylhydantoinase A/oxoprolinase/acetone carboxylase beta subunit